MDKYQKAIAAYAQNRIDLAKNKSQISHLFGDPEDRFYNDIDLSEYRELYFETDHQDEYPDRWHGWVYCLEFADEYEPREMQLAVLLDKKKEILREAGQIKRNISALGRGLLKGANK